jgi:hypothetical protein
MSCLADSKLRTTVLWIIHTGRKPLRTLLLWPLIPLMLSACNDGGKNQTPNIEPIAANIKTVVPLAYAASVAMEAVTGNGVANAQVSNRCTSFPCLSLVTIMLQAEQVPVRLDEYGQVLIAGLWSSPTQAVMTFSFTSLKIATGDYPVLEISTIPVVRNNDGLVLAYGSIDINIDSEPVDSVSLDDAQVQAELKRVDTATSDDPNINVRMDAFVVRVDNAGSPADFSDDTYTVSGGGQYADVNSDSTRVLQLGMANVRMTSACKLNPDQGFAVVNELAVSTGDASQWPKLGVASFAFHAECDGRANVPAAIGTYGIISNRDIELGM